MLTEKELIKLLPLKPLITNGISTGKLVGINVESHTVSLLYYDKDLEKERYQYAQVYDGDGFDLV